MIRLRAGSVESYTTTFYHNNGATETFPVTHNLNSRDLKVEVMDLVNYYRVADYYEQGSGGTGRGMLMYYDTLNSISITFYSGFYFTGNYQVTVYKLL